VRGLAHLTGQLELSEESTQAGPEMIPKNPRRFWNAVLLVLAFCSLLAVNAVLLTKAPVLYIWSMVAILCGLPCLALCVILLLTVWNTYIDP
jgi:hypothetical protein